MVLVRRFSIPPLLPKMPPRHFKTPAQLASLEAAFAANPDTNPAGRRALCAEIGLSFDQVTVSGWHGI